MRDPTDILHWRRIDDRVTTSGQPSEMQLAALQKQGVKMIINLGIHTHEQALPDETESVAALGMRYVHIPVPFDAPDDADFEAFAAAMKEASGERVHVHCVANMRVSAFLYRYQRDVLGKSDAESRAAMDALWRPGGVWARFIGDLANTDQPHGPAPGPSCD
jgi:protein tyrosine phosphatase (PTP) superfamily phosphohydrolase (DUF442 family)